MKTRLPGNATLKVPEESRRTSMPLKATSVRLDEETLEQLGAMADAMDRPRAWLMAYAIKQYVAREQRFMEDVKSGIDAADQGRLVDHEDVKARWEAKRAAQVD